MLESSGLPFRKHACHNVPFSPSVYAFLSEGVLAVVAPQVRKHLSADALLSLLRSGFAALADHRPGQPDISLTDALLSAFALFSLKSPSLLAFDKERTEGNLHQVYGIERVPCDTAMREILDPVEPELLRLLFKHVFRALQRGKALEEMVFVEGHYLVAFDGTGYFSSQPIHCASCLERHHRNGTITYSHQMLGAALIHPDRCFLCQTPPLARSGVLATAAACPCAAQGCSNATRWRPRHPRRAGSRAGRGSKRRSQGRRVGKRPCSVRRGRICRATGSSCSSKGSTA
jgi:hypothetical protein